MTLVVRVPVCSLIASVHAAFEAWGFGICALVEINRGLSRVRKYW